MKIAISVDIEKDLDGNYKGISAIDSLLKILDKRKIKATFLIPAKAIEKFPKKFKKLKKQGHEIALHGYKHERWDELKKENKEKPLKKAISIYRRIFKSYPAGFRAPQHSIDKETLFLLEKYNFKYDSSLIPWNFHHIFFPQIKIKFSNNFKKMKPHRINKLKEIPISSFILPFSAFTIRLLPYNLFKIYLRIINKYKVKVFFMHSWDLTEMPKSRLYRRCPLNKFLSRFEYMLDFFKENEFVKLEEI